MDSFIIQSYEPNANNIYLFLRLGSESTRVYAIRASNANSEICMLECLAKLSFTTTPLMHFLISARLPNPKGGALPLQQPLKSYPVNNINLDRLYELGAATIAEYRLNDDQAAVLESILSW